MTAQQTLFAEARLVLHVDQIVLPVAESLLAPLAVVVRFRPVRLQMRLEVIGSFEQFLTLAALVRSIAGKLRHRWRSFADCSRFGYELAFVLVFRVIIAAVEDVRNVGQAGLFQLRYDFVGSVFFIELTADKFFRGNFLAHVFVVIRQSNHIVIMFRFYG